ncbi:PREDICTED: uncharacterized protein LOC106815750 [Priapulus caudatus]|uniref:Uncharacterized protein LOC106815750 n=1 Tax=Priapulus caudatus TaxID=37621 RepID=A0ABM1EU73_PRICU|nr:PREDICTED: uncharacterized protein LOC106815750 [Priapulus caudatus]
MVGWQGSRAHNILTNIVTANILKRDIPKLAPEEQTSSLESYHNVVIRFAPKSVHFHYSAMKARLTLAILHFNENSAREQQTNSDGSKQFRISYPKSKKGGAIAKEVKVPCTYNYVRELMAMVILLRRQYPSYQRAKTLIDHTSSCYLNLHTAG